MKETLENIAFLRNNLQNVSIESYGFAGYLESATNEIISLIKKLPSNTIRECYYTENKEDVNFDNIEKNKRICIKINLANIKGYYNTVSEFINANKYALNYKLFYIQEIDYFEGKSNKNKKIEDYKTNIEFINLLKNISDYNKVSAGELELFFYKAEQGVAFSIDYNWNQIPNNFSEIDSIIKDLKSQLNNSADSKERKQIFSNELIAILKKNNNSYVALLENIQTLIDNYEKSFDLYLSGFSFDKIKTASIEYFHELTDRINSTILKYSTYIFAMPLAYIFLIRFLDFKGKNFLKDTFLVILGGIFFVLIWCVLFKNIDDAISSVESDISSFENKLDNDVKLESIKNELDEQKNSILPRQRKKLRLVKILTVIILGLLIFAYASIHYENFKSIYLKLKSEKPVNNQSLSIEINDSRHTISTFAIRTSQRYNPKLQKSLFANANKLNVKEIEKHEITTKAIRNAGIVPIPNSNIIAINKISSKLKLWSFKIRHCS